MNPLQKAIDSARADLPQTPGVIELRELQLHPEEDPIFFECPQEINAWQADQILQNMWPGASTVLNGRRLTKTASGDFAESCTRPLDADDETEEILQKSASTARQQRRQQQQKLSFGESLLGLYVLSAGENEL